MYGLNQSILGNLPFVFNDGLLIAKSFCDSYRQPQKKAALSSRFFTDIHLITNQ